MYRLVAHSHCSGSRRLLDFIQGKTSADTTDVLQTLCLLNMGGAWLYMMQELRYQ